MFGIVVKRSREILTTWVRAASAAAGRRLAAARALRRPICGAVAAAALVAGLTIALPGPRAPGPESAAERAPVSASVQRARLAPRRALASVPAADFLDKPQGVNVVTASAKKLYSDFRRIGYRLEDLRKGAGNVPRVFVKAMPKDIGLLRSTQQRKAVFIKTMLPLILHINEELRATRARVGQLAAKEAGGEALTPRERGWLEDQYDRFDVQPGDLETLLRRIDVVPPSLAMAQGAAESGWGSSRFAVEGRALFGQRTFKEAPGMVPHGQAEGARFKVRRFEHLLDGVRSYVHNLNTHPAYARFRALRAELRAQAGGLDGIDSLKLVETLERYSERGASYVKTIKSIIRFNDLRALDDDRLSGIEPVEAAPDSA